MEIERGGGKRKAPEEGSGIPLPTQPTSKPALELAETWTNLSPQIGTSLFGQMDVATFVKYCSMSIRIRNWCDMVRSHYPTLFVQALEQMLLRSDMHSIMATCGSVGSEIWQHAGYKNEEWLERRRADDPNDYPQVRGEVWKAIFDTSVLPCIPPYYTASATTSLRPRRRAEMIWRILSDEVTDTPDAWDLEALLHVPPRQMRLIDENLVTKIVVDAMRTGRMKYLVLNEVWMRGLLSGKLHYRDQAFTVIIGRPNPQHPANAPHEWKLVAAAPRSYPAPKGIGELHPNIDARPELTNTRVTVTDASGRQTVYMNSIFESVTIKPQFVACVLTPLDDARSILERQMVADYGRPILKQSTYAAASLATLAALTAPAPPPRLFEQSDESNQGLFATVHNALMKRMPDRKLHWTMLQEDTMDRIPRSVSVDRTYGVYNYRSGTYERKFEDRRIFDRALAAEQTVFNERLPMRYFMFKDQEAGPSELVKYDLRNGRDAYYLIFMHPTLLSYDWYNPTTGEAAAQLILLRIMSFELIKATGEAVDVRNMYIPMSFNLSTNPWNYTATGCDFSNLLYNAEVRRAYIDSYLTYAPYLAAPGGPIEEVRYRRMIRQFTSVAIERFFTLPEIVLRAVERGLGVPPPPVIASGADEDQPIDIESYLAHSTVSIARRLEPAAAVRTYMGYFIQLLFTYNAQFNQDSVVSYYYDTAVGTISKFAIASLIGTIDRLTQLFDLIVGDPSGIAGHPLWAELRREYTLDRNRPDAAISGLLEWFRVPERRKLEQNDAYELRKEEVESQHIAAYGKIMRRWRFAHLFTMFQQYLLGTPRFLRGVVLFVEIADLLYHPFIENHSSNMAHIAETLAQLEIDVTLGRMQPPPRVAIDAMDESPANAQIPTTNEASAVSQSRALW